MCIDRQLESICQSHLFGQVVTYCNWDNTFHEIHVKLKKMKKGSLMYITFQHLQWNPFEATETKRKMSLAKHALPFFPHDRWCNSLTHFLEFFWFGMLSWIRSFLATNGKGYDNSQLNDDIHRGSQQIHDKWLEYALPVPHVHNHKMDLQWKPLSNLYKKCSHLYCMN